MRNVQDSIEIVADEIQKRQWEQQHRSLWRSCFGDPLHYEDFYFDKVYSKNRVYTMSDKGMVHLNYYRCNVMEKELELPYIVGVSTDERYRRQGVMRSLLEKAIHNMYDERVPFTYLMPANVAYYEPFGFQSISRKKEFEITLDSDRRMDDLHFISYKDIKKLHADKKDCLFDVVNNWLDKRYDIYAVHDEAYYDLLYAEKACQSGDVIFCFDGEVNAKDLCSVFAYALDENTPYVEQMITADSKQQSRDWLQCILTSYFCENEVVKVVLSYPYMIRIVHRESFLELFERSLLQKSGQAYDNMTDSQLIETLFDGKENIYFSEIV